MCCSKCFNSIFMGSGVFGGGGGCFVLQPIPLLPPSPLSLPQRGVGFLSVCVCGRGRGGGEEWPGGWGSSASGGHLCVDGVCEAHVERVVVLHQGGLVVVEHQVLQAAVQVVGLGEAEAARRAVDDAVLHLAVDAEDTERTPSITQGFTLVMLLLIILMSLNQHNPTKRHSVRDRNQRLVSLSINL